MIFSKTWWFLEKIWLKFWPLRKFWANLQKTLEIEILSWNFYWNYTPSRTTIVQSFMYLQLWVDNSKNIFFKSPFLGLWNDLAQRLKNLKFNQNWGWLLDISCLKYLCGVFSFWPIVHRFLMPSFLTVFLQ